MDELFQEEGQWAKDRLQGTQTLKRQTEEEVLEETANKWLEWPKKNQETVEFREPKCHTLRKQGLPIVSDSEEARENSGLKKKKIPWIQPLRSHECYPESNVSTSLKNEAALGVGDRGRACGTWMFLGWERMNYVQRLRGRELLRQRKTEDISQDGEEEKALTDTAGPGVTGDVARSTGETVALNMKHR